MFIASKPKYIHKKRSKEENQYILIVTSEHDKSTSDVIEWLIFKKKYFFRLNDDVVVDVKSVALNNKLIRIVFEYKGKLFDTQKIKSFWFRRGNVSINISNIPQIDENISRYLNREKKAVETFLIYELDKKARINHIVNSTINKLIQLDIAIKCKLKTPDTFLTSASTDLKKFIKEKRKIITKSIQASFDYHNNNKQFSLMTSLFNSSDLTKCSPNFFITKFQNQIKKQFELRILYLNGIFYSMAIFSQGNPKTRVDFRNYDLKTPNRSVPFKLPLNIEKRLKLFMNKIGLLSGSIDMVVCNGEYYFLEVNPIGQFGMVSRPCNYYIEEKIANILSSKNHG